MYELTLPDMTCGHCVRSVTTTVHKIDPAAEITIDLPTHKVQIVSNIAAESFQTALADEGYPAG